jgi:hypothetical protein
VSLNHLPKAICYPYNLCTAFRWPENAFHQGSWEPWLKITWPPVNKFSTFWRPEKKFLPFREILHCTVTGFMWTTVRHFGALKMSILKGHGTLGSRVSCFHWAIVRHSIPQGARDPRLKGIWFLVNPFLAFWLMKMGFITGVEILYSWLPGFSIFSPANTISASLWNLGF